MFAVQGSERCDLAKRSFFQFSNEFYGDCKKECPLKSCFSEKLSIESEENSDSNFYPCFAFAFRDLSALNITQIPKTDGFTFLNNIGGGLGLFMGIAFPNLIEFLQFMILI